MSFARIAQLMTRLMVEELGFQHQPALVHRYRRRVDPALSRSRARPWGSGRVELPSAILMPLHDAVTVPAPREWAERSYAVARWTMLERGGHLSQSEVPPPRRR